MPDLDYLDLIGRKDLTVFLLEARDVFPGFTTINASYEDKLTEMKQALAAYFDDATLQRPFLYLVLGPPGAGKSFLLKAMVKQLKREMKGPVAYQSVNISEVLDPRELHRLYENILRNNDVGVHTVTLFDEVDVKWRDGAAIKYIINPIYDGQYWDGAQFRTFGRCAFFFAGSYLQDRETLVKTQKVLTGMDLSRFLLDLYLAFTRRGDLDGAGKLHQALEFCHVQQRWRMHADPRTDAILYLRNLDKMRDFLSRIAGNVFEMVDVSAPLQITQDAFVVSGGESVRASPRLRPVEVVRMIKKAESISGKFEVFTSPAEPLLKYKNALLCERLLRVLGMVRKRFETDNWKKGGRALNIRRNTLNYLTVAPLINGMRSLEQLVNRLVLNGDTAVDQQSGFKQEEIAMIVHNAEEYDNVGNVWEKLVRNNPRLSELLVKYGSSDVDDVRIVGGKPTAAAAQ